MTAVDQVRRDEIREKGPAQQVLMHKTRFIWLKNPWNLTERQHRRLSELQRLNLKINRAYLLKETFAHFWDYRRAGWAKRYLTHWFWWATHSRLPPLRNFAWMLRRYERDILNYFRMPIDNGTVEGLNNRFLTQMCARFSPQQVSHAVERGCGCARARESAVKSSIAQSTAACTGPAFGGGPARRQPVPPQGAEALAFTGQRTMNTRGTRPGLSPTFYRWAEPSLTVQPLGTGRPLVISAVYRGPDFPRACSSSPETDGVLQPRKSMTMFDLLAMEPAKAAPIPERNRTTKPSSSSTGPTDSGRQVTTSGTSITAWPTCRCLKLCIHSCEEPDENALIGCCSGPRLTWNTNWLHFRTSITRIEPMRRWKGGRPSRHGRMSQRSTATAGTSIVAASIRRRSRRDIGTAKTLASVSMRPRVESCSVIAIAQQQGSASATHLTHAIARTVRMTPAPAT